MLIQSKKMAMVNAVMTCSHCHLLSGCIVSDLKGKERTEINSYFDELSCKSIDWIFSYHESCPYRGRLKI